MTTASVDRERSGIGQGFESRQIGELEETSRQSRDQIGRDRPADRRLPQGLADLGKGFHRTDHRFAGQHPDGRGDSSELIGILQAIDQDRVDLPRKLAEVEVFPPRAGKQSDRWQVESLGNRAEPTRSAMMLAAQSRGWLFQGSLDQGQIGALRTPSEHAPADLRRHQPGVQMASG